MAAPAAGAPYTSRTAPPRTASFPRQRGPPSSRRVAPRDLLPDAAAGARDDGHLAGERPGPVRDGLGGGLAASPDPDDLAGDVGRLGREEERQRRLDGGVGRGCDVHQLHRAAPPDLLAERAREALERALGDAL